MNVIIASLVILLIGYFMGYSAKGITININKNEDSNLLPTEYNESVVDALDPEVRSYYEQTNGLNKF
jgi:hypothetical protein